MTTEIKPFTEEDYQAIKSRLPQQPSEKVDAETKGYWALCIAYTAKLHNAKPFKLPRMEAERVAFVARLVEKHHEAVALCEQQETLDELTANAIKGVWMQTFDEIKKKLRRYGLSDKTRVGR